MDAKESSKLTESLNQLEGSLKKLDAFVSAAIGRNKQETKDKYNVNYAHVEAKFHEVRKLVRDLRK